MSTTYVTCGRVLHRTTLATRDQATVCPFEGRLVFRAGRAECPTCLGTILRPNPTIPELLHFEATHTDRRSKEDAIRQDLDLAPARYYQLLDRAIDTEDALRTDPVLTNRLRRIRDRDARTLTARLQPTR